MALLTRGKKLIINTRYGDLSRGKSWGKFYPGQVCARGEWEWAPKRGGQLVIDRAGYLVYGSDDGYARKEKEEMLIEWRPDEPAPATQAPASASE